MSNISTPNNSSLVQEQLFTELTAEEASVIEGGLFLLIDKIQAIKAGADFLSADDTYITVNGKKITGEYSLTTGKTATVNLGLDIGNQARVELFDADGPQWLNPDDNLGGFDVKASTKGQQIRARVSGSGSTYDVYYRVF